MKKTTLHIVAIIALLFAFFPTLSAQILRGFVRSGPNGHGLNGVTVSVKEIPSISTITYQGSYTLSFDIDMIWTTVTLVANSMERVYVIQPGVSYLDFLFDAVTDLDGNSYNAIEISSIDGKNSQTWIDENLKVTHYRDGTIIPLVTNESEWGNLRTPAYCWYTDGSNNTISTYGPLYNWYAVSTRNLCPTGWHVPWDAEMERLSSFLDGLGGAGAKMKETGSLHWASPNTGATNESNFTGLPGGFRSHVGWFADLSESGAFWTSSETSLESSTAYWYLLRVNQDALERRGSESYESKEAGFSVRCIKDTLTTKAAHSIKINSAQSGGFIAQNQEVVAVEGVCWSTLPNPTISDYHTTRTLMFPGDLANLGEFNATLTGLLANTTYYVKAYATDIDGVTIYGNEISFKTYKSDAITDNDGNYYDKVKIGSQVWLAENLKTTTYNDGTVILNVTDNEEWGDLTSGAYCWYNNDQATFGNTYGALYNWYVVDGASNGGKNACPTGWHVATDADWSTLASFVDPTLNESGGKLKEAGTTHWNSPNVATNESGFTALPGGFRDNNGRFSNNGEIGNTGFWWTSTVFSSGSAYMRGMYNNNSSIGTAGLLTVFGNSVRCIKDVVTDIDGNTYNTVTIGDQLWFQENLKVTKYRNGDAIPNVTDLPVWSNLTSGAYCNYDNNDSNGDLYGRLYNAYSTVDNRNLCPADWRIPTEYDWIVLENYLIENGYNYDGTNTGNKIAKSMASETGWQLSATPGAVGNEDYPAFRNKSGFSGLPTGFLYPVTTTLPGFNSFGSGAVWWTSTEVDPTHTTAASIWWDWANETRTMYGTGDLKNSGFSVRCIHGEPIIVTNTGDQGNGSLRKAIDDANSNPGSDVIIFNIPGTDPFTIKPASPLPTITDPVVIDGYSQPGASLATLTQLIQLDGTGSGTGSNGLTINASNCSVRGMVINNFLGNGIQIAGGTENWIKANSIYDNAGLGIMLSENTNNNQSSPVLDKTVINSGDIYLDGKLTSLPYKYFTLDFFASKLADNSGNGEGQIYLGSATTTTSEDGIALFTNLKFPYQTIYGDVITATATDPDRNTSEFSKAIGGLPNQHLGYNSLDYYVNPTGIPNIADENKIVNAVNNAFNTWTGITTANFTFNYVNTTDEQHAHIDGENVVSFSDDEYLFGDWVLAITAKTLKLGLTDTETQILDADIIFNPYFAKHKLWNFGIADDPLNSGFFDIQSITTHEIGHILGLLHTGVHNSTMWFEMPQGIDARSLEQDDKSWASYKYPEPGNNFGSISGHITYGYDPSLSEPIAGALVLAINTATRDTVHSYSDVDGNYFVPGLKVGTYNVYIEPLDGDVRNRPLSPRNISLYIYCNTTNFDYPGEFYSGTNESAAEIQDILASVTVNTGTGTSDVNFITNKDITNPTVVSVTPPDISKSCDVGIRFSEPMNMATLIKDNCYLIKSGETTQIGGSYTELESGTNAILFYPEEVLDYSTTYTLYITGGVTDLKGLPLLETYTYGFDTGAGDTNSPTVIGIVPSNGATGVFVNDKIVISFSEAMDKLSVQDNLTVSPVIIPTFVWDNENKILTVAPSSNFTEGGVYNITLATGAEDMSGNTIGNNISSSFTVVSAAAPEIKYLEPGQTMTSGITAKTPVVVDFTEPINTNTVNETTFKLLKGEVGGTPVEGTFEFLNENSRVVFRPLADLDFSQKYTVILTTGISDVSQSTQNLQDEISVSFTTVAQPTVPFIKFIDPPSDHVGAQVTIGGSGFDPDPSLNAVTFFNGIAAPVISATLTSLTVAVPAGAESGIVHVSVNGVQESAVSPYNFLVIQPYSDPCNEARGSAQTGGDSRDVATDFNGTKAYVTNSGSNTVSVVDLETLETVNTIDVGEYPLMIDIDPLGTRGYVTNFGSRTVSVIDLITETEIKKINVGINPYGVAVSPDGEHVFVANYTTQDISVIDADPTSGGFDHVTSNIVTGTENRKLDIDANSSMIVVTGNDGLKIIELIKTEFGFDYSTTNASAGTPTRDTKIITEAGLAVVSTIDGRLMFIGVTKGTDTFGAVVANSSSGAKAGQVQPDFSGVFLYVSNPYDNQVTVYKMTYGGSGSEIGSYNGFSIEEYWTIPTGISPQGMNINRLNNELLVVNEFEKLGSTTGSVTAVKICCRENSSSDDIVALALYIQGMINSTTIKETLGKMLIVKLNDAVIYIDKGKTKTAINSMKTFIDKVNELKAGGKVTAADAKVLIEAANAIIAKLKAGKSDPSEIPLIDGEQLNLPDSITETKLGIIYPNPAKESITINYEIASDDMNSGKVTIQVYDIIGRLVGNLVNTTQDPGRYSVTWNGYYENGGPAPRGIYYVRFTAGTVREVRQIMLVR